MPAGAAFGAFLTLGFLGGMGLDTEAWVSVNRRICIIMAYRYWEALRSRWKRYDSCTSRRSAPTRPSLQRSEPSCPSSSRTGSCRGSAFVTNFDRCTDVGPMATPMAPPVKVRITQIISVLNMHVKIGSPSSQAFTFRA